MQTTTQHQITLLAQMLSMMSVVEGSEKEVFLAARFSIEDRQAIHDTADTLASLKLINWEEIKLEFQNNHGPVGGGEDAKKYLRIVETLDLLIETFRG